MSFGINFSIDLIVREMRVQASAIICLIIAGILCEAGAQPNGDSTDLRRKAYPIVAGYIGWHGDPFGHNAASDVRPGLMLGGELEFPFDRDRNWSICGVYYSWRGKQVAGSAGLETASTKGLSLSLRFQSGKYGERVRPFAEIGGAPWPLLTWAIGGGVNWWMFEERLAITAGVRHHFIMFPGLISSSGPYFPAIVFGGVRFAL